MLIDGTGNYSVSNENRITLTESQRHRENQTSLAHLSASVSP